MFKIWAKLLDEDRRIIKDKIYVGEGKFDKNKFFDYVSEIARELDIATPNILTYHINNFHKFNYVKFTPRDFMEEVHFEQMVLESGN